VTPDHTPTPRLLSSRVAEALYLATVGPLTAIASALACAATGGHLAAYFGTLVVLAFAAGWWHERPVAWIQRWLARKPTPGE
jgi:hypothetical protein